MLGRFEDSRFHENLSGPWVLHTQLTENECHMWGEVGVCPLESQGGLQPLPPGHTVEKDGSWTVQKRFMHDKRGDETSACLPT